ncbi:hypothetical protein ES703_32311 [subsurface metagenome]
MGRVAIALVLALSLSLVMAVPAAAQETSNYAGFMLQVEVIDDTGGTATWVEDATSSGNYAAHLSTGDPGTSKAVDSARVVLFYGQALSTITEAGYSYKIDAGRPANDSAPYIYFALDTTGNDTADTWVIHTMFSTAEADMWGTWLLSTDTVDPAWHASGAKTTDSPYTDWSAVKTVFDDDTVLEIKVAVGEWSSDHLESHWVDDITINEITYDLEPMVLDAERYSIGETVNVTLCNGILDADAMAIDTVDIKVKSVTDTHGDTVTLTETGSATGVFTGPITLLGAPPADREADEIVVSAEDTVTVTYTEGDWGAGSDTIILTAFVDDAAPVIIIVSPEDDDIIITAMPEIAASYSDAGSGIDEASVVITVDTVDVTEDANTFVGGADITYTPSADLDDGTHTVTVDVSDKVGNTATASWSFTVDTLAPVITDPEATPPVVEPDIENTIVFTAPVTDATSGVDTVTIDLSTIGGVSDTAMLDDGLLSDVEESDGIYTAEITTTLTEAGSPYTLTVTAIDLATNESVAVEIELVCSSDIVPPEITDLDITYPFVGVDSAQPDDPVTIFATVTDIVGMGTVTAECDVVTKVVGEETVPIVIDLLDGGVTPDVEADDGIYTGTATVDSDAGWGDYPVTITAKDAKGNEAIDESLILAVRYGATGYDLDLVEGWNLISLPLIPDSSNIMVVISATTLLSEDVSNVGTVLGYDPATGDFPRYIPGTGGALAEMEDGQGYWVFMEEADTLTITGRQLPVPPAVPPTYDVVEGWNLIGFKSLEDDIDTNYLANITGTYPVLWSYNAVAGAYSNVKDVVPPDGMVVGHGFWIWINEAGTIVPPK